MRITSIDIQRQKFRTALRGYDAEEVKNFLISVAEQMEELNRQNDKLKQETEHLRDTLNDHEERDKILKSTLVTAQKTAESLTNNARKEADLIVKEAEFKASKVMEHAQSQVIKIQKDMLDLRLQRKALQEKIQTSISIIQKMLEYQKEEEKSAEKVMYYARNPGERKANAE
jgi:cell division initiation protein